MGKQSPPEYKGANLTLIIDTYEKAAIRSETREGVLASALGPLYACRQIVESGQRTLGVLARQKTEAETSVAETAVESKAKQEAQSWEDYNDPEVQSSGCVDITPEWDVSTPQVNIIDKEVDLWQEMGDWLGLDPEIWNSTNMEECFGCDLRMELDWQLPSLNIALPILDLLGDIEGIVNDLLGRIDPYGMLEELCLFFDGLFPICIPDLIAMLIAFKLLIRKYLTFALELKLDWTAIIGPLLKLIVDALASLVNQIQAIILAPLDCIIDALEMANDLINQAADTWNTALAAGQAVGSAIKNPFDAVSASATPSPEISYEASDLDEASFGDKVAAALQDPHAGAIGSFDTQGSGTAAASGSFGLQTGATFTLKSGDTLESALKEKNTEPPNILETVILTLREARDYIKKFFAMIMFSLKSLNAFMSGGLGLQLQNAGILLLVMDIISLVMLIMQMKQQGINLKDWCKQLDDEPEYGKLLNMIDTQYPGTKASMAEDRTAIFVERGSETRKIPLCATDRDKAPGKEALVENWLSELEGHMRRG